MVLLTKFADDREFVVLSSIVICPPGVEKAGVPNRGRERVPPGPTATRDTKLGSTSTTSSSRDTNAFDFI